MVYKPSILQCWFRETNTVQYISRIFCLMFSINAIKPNVDKYKSIEVLNQILFISYATA